MKACIAALALSLPLWTASIALAEGCHGDRMGPTAMSCMEGSVWNPETARCVPQPSS